MDLNHLLLFVAFISPLILIARSQRHATANRGWRVAAVVVFLTAGAAWFLFPAGAGYIAGVAWLGLLLIPALSVRQIASRMLCQRFTSARRLARFLTFLHPAD